MRTSSPSCWHTFVFFTVWSGMRPKWMCGKWAQFLAAALKASLWVISGFTDLMRWISSLIKRLYAEGTLCLFSGAGQWNPVTCQNHFLWLSVAIFILFFLAILVPIFCGMGHCWLCLHICLCFWFWWYCWVLKVLSNYNSGGEETTLYVFLSLRPIFLHATYEHQSNK